MATSSAASNATAAEAESAEIGNVFKRSSTDIGWQFGELWDPKSLDKIQCKLCKKKFSGGIYRLKCHIAGRTGNVKACDKASAEAKKICREALDSVKRRKTQKQNEEVELRKEVSKSDGGAESREMDDDEGIISPGSKRPIDYGPMGKFVEINPSSDDSKKMTRQANIIALLDKKKVMEAQQYVARWVIESGVPFNATQNESFKLMCEAIGQFGPSFPVPSRYRLSGQMLKVEVARVKKSLTKHETEWGISGCSIMTDAWSDRKRRSIMNLCVHCKEGMDCMDAFLNCVEKFFPDDFDTQNLVSNIEMLKYKSLQGMFGRRQAVDAYKDSNSFDPAGWWSNYGGGTPNLKKMAIRILSLTTSSSGCERNWSTFEGVHTNKRNRLESERLNNLVYVQFNSKLIYKKKKMDNDKDVLLADDSSRAQHWLIDGDDENDVDPVTGATWEVLDQAMGAGEELEPRRSARIVRELDEEDFESEVSLEEEGGDDDFESDEAREIDDLLDEHDPIFDD